VNELQIGADDDAIYYPGEEAPKSANQASIPMDMRNLPMNADPPANAGGPLEDQHAVYVEAMARGADEEMARRVAGDVMARGSSGQFFQGADPDTQFGQTWNQQARGDPSPLKSSAFTKPRNRISTPGPPPAVSTLPYTPGGPPTPVSTLPYTPGGPPPAVSTLRGPPYMASSGPGGPPPAVSTLRGPPYMASSGPGGDPSAFTRPNPSLPTPPPQQSFQGEFGPILPEGTPAPAGAAFTHVEQDNQGNVYKVYETDDGFLRVAVAPPAVSPGPILSGPTNLPTEPPPPPAVSTLPYTPGGGLPSMQLDRNRAQAGYDDSYGGLQVKVYMAANGDPQPFTPGGGDPATMYRWYQEAVGMEYPKAMNLWMQDPGSAIAEFNQFKMGLGRTDYQAPGTPPADDVVAAVEEEGAVDGQSIEELIRRYMEREYPQLEIEKPEIRSGYEDPDRSVFGPFDGKAGSAVDNIRRLIKSQGDLFGYGDDTSLLDAVASIFGDQPINWSSIEGQLRGEDYSRQILEEMDPTASGMGYDGARDVRLLGDPLEGWEPGGEEWEPGGSRPGASPGANVPTLSGIVDQINSLTGLDKSEKAAIASAAVAGGMELAAVAENAAAAMYGTDRQTEVALKQIAAQARDIELARRNEYIGVTGSLMVGAYDAMSDRFARMGQIASTHQLGEMAAVIEAAIADQDYETALLELGNLRQGIENDYNLGVRQLNSQERLGLAQIDAELARAEADINARIITTLEPARLQALTAIVGGPVGLMMLAQANRAAGNQPVTFLEILGDALASLGAPSGILPPIGARATNQVVNSPLQMQIGEAALGEAFAPWMQTQTAALAPANALQSSAIAY